MNHHAARRIAAAAALLLTLTLTGCASTETTPRADALQTLRIGSWNIEWLDQPQRRSGPARGVQQSPEDIADYIAESGVGVLALQEITTNAPDGSPTNTTLTEAFAILSDRGADWRHVIFPSSRNQNVGVAWDASRVTLRSDPAGYAVPVERVESPQGRTVWSRPPRAMFFTAGQGRTDFVIIPIHMKSNYGGDFSVHRAYEAQTLAAALPVVAQRFTDFDVLVIGDANSPSTADESIRAYEDAGLIDLNKDDEPTYWRGAALDRILVPAAQPEFADPDFEVFFDEYAAPRGLDEEAFKQRWSDHWMVVFTLRVMEDDD